MGTYDLSFRSLESLVTQEDKAEGELLDCIDVISNKLMRKLNDLPGSDDGGFILSAAEVIAEKNTAMTEKAEALATFGRGVTLFTDFAYSVDQQVSDKFDEMAEEHKQPWSFVNAYRSVTGFFYNVFCVEAADLFDDWFPFGEEILGFLRKTANKVSHWLDDVRFFFTHGDGQYVKNMFISVLAVAGAVFLVISTVVAALSASLVLLAGLAVVLGVIFIVYSSLNCAATISDSLTAQKHAKNGNRIFAHYYAGTDDILDWGNKRDFGNADDNLRMEKVLIVADNVGKTSEIGLHLVSIATSFLSLGNVYSRDGKKVIGHSYDNKTVIKNIKRKYKKVFLSSGYDEVKVSGKKERKLNLIEVLFTQEKGYLEDITGKDTFKKAKAVKKSVDMVKDFITDGRSQRMKVMETIDDYWKDPSLEGIADILKDVPSILGGPGNIVDSYTSPWAKYAKAVWKMSAESTA